MLKNKKNLSFVVMLPFLVACGVDDAQFEETYQTTSSDTGDDSDSSDPLMEVTVSRIHIPSPLDALACPGACDATVNVSLSSYKENKWRAYRHNPSGQYAPLSLYVRKSAITGTGVTTEIYYKFNEQTHHTVLSNTFRMSKTNDSEEKRVFSTGRYPVSAILSIQPFHLSGQNIEALAHEYRVVFDSPPVSENRCDVDDEGQPVGRCTALKVEFSSATQTVRGLVLIGSDSARAGLYQTQYLVATRDELMKTGIKMTVKDDRGGNGLKLLHTQMRLFSAADLYTGTRVCGRYLGMFEICMRAVPVTRSE